MVKTIMTEWDLFERRPLLKRGVDLKSLSGITIKAFIQARTASKRLPNKIYRQLNGAPLLFHVIARVKEAKLVEEVLVISPEQLPELPEGISNFVYSGLENDVLGRYVAAVAANPCDYIIRITADCPLLDPHLIDLVIASSIGSEYGSNVLTCTFPNGMDVEVMSFQTLKYLDAHVRNIYDREHVTTFIRNNPFIQADMNLVSIQSVKDYSYLKLSVDEEDDLKRVSLMELWEKQPA